MKLEWLIIIALLILLLCFYLYYQLFSVRITKYTISIKDLPASFDKFTILHLSDLHEKQFGKNQDKLMQQVNSTKYDIVVITGDLLSKYKNSISASIELINRLNSKPIYFVSGNHEWWANYDEFKELLLNNGVEVLDNRAEKITKDGKHIWLAGVDDPYLHKDRLDKALEDIDTQAPKVLLAHAPEIFSSAVKEKIDLVLVGHTHGGQIRIPLYGGALIAPGQGMFPKLDYGLFKHEDTTMIINSGLGESILPVRINNRPEIGLIELIVNN